MVLQAFPRTFCSRDSSNVKSRRGGKAAAKNDATRRGSSFASDPAIAWLL
jgi:hypothetical protein